MVRMLMFLVAVQLVLVILALISSLSAERVRTMPRAVWVLVIIIVPLLGPVAYFVAGRPVKESARRPGVPTRPSAPDDDPEFLRTLNPDRSRRDRESFEQWESDLRRRSDEADTARPQPDTARPQPDTARPQPDTARPQPDAARPEQPDAARREQPDAAPPEQADAAHIDEADARKDETPPTEV